MKGNEMAKYDAEIKHQQKLAVWAERARMPHKQSIHEAAVKYWKELQEEEANK
tara:strand:+ start:359 stop:517 length:159 start_codon:yes stop_codon:yes gene_type:complete